MHDLLLGFLLLSFVVSCKLKTHVNNEENPRNDNGAQEEDPAIFSLLDPSTVIPEVGEEDLVRFAEHRRENGKHTQVEMFGSHWTTDKMSELIKKTEKRFIVMPSLLLSGDYGHWTSVILDLKTRKIMYYDPMGNSTFIEKTREKFEARLVRINQGLLPDEQFKPEQHISNSGFPHQAGNAVDCGLYVMRLSEELETRAVAAPQNLEILAEVAKMPRMFGRTGSATLQSPEPLSETNPKFLEFHRDVLTANMEAFDYRLKVRAELYPRPPESSSPDALKQYQERVEEYREKMRQAAIAEIHGPDNRIAILSPAAPSAPTTKAHPLSKKPRNLKLLWRSVVNGQLMN